MRHRMTKKTQNDYKAGFKSPKIETRGSYAQNDQKYTLD